MSEVTARITARGLHEGVEVAIECIEYTEGGLRHVVVLKDGKEDMRANLLFSKCVLRRYSNRLESPHCYNPPFNSAAAYWLALEDYFDEPPETTTEGDVLPRQYTEEEIRTIRF